VIHNWTPVKSRQATSFGFRRDKGIESPPKAGRPLNSGALIVKELLAIQSIFIDVWCRAFRPFFSGPIYALTPVLKAQVSSNESLVRNSDRRTEEKENQNSDL